MADPKDVSSASGRVSVTACQYMKARRPASPSSVAIIFHPPPPPPHPREKIRLVAELLLEKETINHDDLVSLIGARPFKGHKSYLEYISANKESKMKDAEAETETKAKETAKDEGGEGDSAAEGGGKGEGESAGEEGEGDGDKETAAAAGSKGT